MKEISKKNIFTYDILIRQLESLFGIDNNEKDIVWLGFEMALESCKNCFSKINSKYYFHNENSFLLNPLHSGQYTIFLYYLSRSLYVSSIANRSLLDKIYYLNRSLNSVDLFYEVDLPKVFYTDHPLGSVIGRAKFGNNFSFQQNCTVGNNKSIYPVISENVIMLTGATIIGECFVGKNTIFGAHSFIKDVNIPKNSIVVGRYPNHRVLKLTREVADGYFDIFKS